MKVLVAIGVIIFISSILLVPVACSPCYVTHQGKIVSITQSDGYVNFVMDGRDETPVVITWDITKPLPFELDKSYKIKVEVRDMFMKDLLIECEEIKMESEK